MSAGAHTELAFEQLVVGSLIDEGGWLGEKPDGAPTDHRRYDAKLGLYPPDLLAFVAATQPRRWEQLVELAGSDERAQASLLTRVAGQLDRRGTIEVLRRGLSEKGVPLRLAYFEPDLDVDPAARTLYDGNRVRVVRQVRFDPNANDSVDLVLFVNGVPTATAELKNSYTGQFAEDAMRQYAERNPANVLFARRALVHFAVDGDLAYMTTRLDGPRTRFLPFNQGSGGPGEPGGSGNPPAREGGHPTEYVWRSVWDRDAWMKLLEKFVFIERPASEAKRTGARPTVIFPRFHQWDVVRACSRHARLHGPGQRYLIQHSAGSGKSKEIAWLAHELSTLHGADGRLVFDKVVVITDRQVLDQQMQRQVKAFEQVPGTVLEVKQDSVQLRHALEGEAARVIISTLQKFPFVLQQLSDADSVLRERRYAVIVDEAHSSQTGESATDVKAVLGNRDPEASEDDGVPPLLLRRLAAHRPQPNLSFFAFTATPKPRTLGLFGTTDGDGVARAFHTYSMRQAVEEGFIVDVLRNYTTYEELMRLEDRAQHAIELPKGKGAGALARYARFHPYSKAQKAAVALTHFEAVARPHVGGEAKGMVVTASREEAVQWKLALDAEIARRGSATKTLVAFSGEVKVHHRDARNRGSAYTEPKMNAIDGRPLPEKRLPREFAKPQYGLLVVAEKYQMGFDEPKLVAMYVDKPLTGVNAVQTLSRLNRTHPLKEETWVLDFVNDTEPVRKEFERFYMRTEALPTDPNVLFDAQQDLLDGDVIDQADVDAFADEWFRSTRPDHAALARFTQPAFDRARALDRDALAELRDALDRFVRFYSYLSQVVPHLPPESEKLFAYARALASRLRRRDGGTAVPIDVALTHYRLRELGSQAIRLGEDEVLPGEAIAGDGTGAPARVDDGAIGRVSELVALFNERFGATLSDADMVHPAEALIDSIDRSRAATLRPQARANTFEDFVRGKQALVIDGAFDAEQTGVERHRISSDFYRGIIEDDEFRARATHLAMRALYERYRGERRSGDD